MKTVPVHVLDCRVIELSERQARLNALAGHDVPNGANVRLFLSSEAWGTEYPLMGDLAESLAHVGSVVIEGPGPERLAQWTDFLSKVPSKPKLTAAELEEQRYEQKLAKMAESEQRERNYAAWIQENQTPTAQDSPPETVAA